MKKIILILTICFIVVTGLMVADYVINRGFVDVSTKKVTRSTIENYTELDGEIRETGRREINVPFPVMVKKLYIEIGDRVKRGEKLAELDKTDLLAKLNILYAQSAGDEVYANLIASVQNMADTIEAPMDGVISDILCSEGSECSIQSPAVIITDIENLIVKTKIPSENLNEVYLGQKAVIFQNNISTEGTVTKIHPVAEQSENDVTTSVSFDITPKSSEGLICGTRADVRLYEKPYKDIMVIPFDSVLFDDNEPYVYVNMSGFAVKKKVTLGKEFDTSVEVLSGIEEKDKLILNPRKYNVKNGDKISGEE